MAYNPPHLTPDKLWQSRRPRANLILQTDGYNLNYEVETKHSSLQIYLKTHKCSSAGPHIRAFNLQKIDHAKLTRWHGTTVSLQTHLKELCFSDTRRDWFKGDWLNASLQSLAALSLLTLFILCQLSKNMFCLCHQCNISDKFLTLLCKHSAFPHLCAFNLRIQTDTK